MTKLTDGIRKKDGSAPRGSAGIKPVFLPPEKPVQKPNPKESAEAEVYHGVEIHTSFLEKFGNKNEADGILVTEELEALEPGRKTFSRFSLPFLGSSRLRWGIVMGGIIVLIFAILLSTVFARTTLTYTPRTEEVTLRDISIAFDSSVSKSLFAQHVLPGEHLQFSLNITEKFESTGKMSLEEKARGKVKLFNAFSSSPQTLVEKTRFISASGAIFRLVKTVVIPGAQIQEGKIVPRFIEVDLVADIAGENGNIPEGTELKIPGFQGTPKYAGFYATASMAFGRGFKGEARVVSAADSKRAQEETTRRIYRELEEEMARKIPPDFILLAPLREILIIAVNVPKENSRHDQFSAEALAEGNAIVFRKKDVLEFMGNLLQAEGKELMEEKTMYELNTKNVDFQKGKANMVLQGNAVLKSLIPSEALAQEIIGQKEGTIIDTLRQRKDIASFHISSFPPWLMRAPSDLNKVKIYTQNP